MEKGRTEGATKTTQARTPLVKWWLLHQARDLEYKDHVWSYDLMMARTVEGKAFRILTIIDEYTRQCLAILTQRRITSGDVIEQLFYLFIFRGTPQYILIWQRPWIYCQGSAQLAKGSRGHNTFHRTRESLGEWIYRVVQWKIKRWASWSGDIHHANRSEDTHWRMAQGIQPGKTPQCSWLQSTCSRGYYSIDSNLRSGTINGGRSIQLSVKILVPFQIYFYLSILVTVDQDFWSFYAWYSNVIS